jgi:hypothetical protein
VEDIEWVVMVARKIWFRKIEVVHGGDFLHPNQLLIEASNFINEFRRVNLGRHSNYLEKNHPHICLKLIGIQLLI